MDFLKIMLVYKPIVVFHPLATIINEIIEEASASLMVAFDSKLHVPEMSINRN